MPQAPKSGEVFIVSLYSAAGAATDTGSALAALDAQLAGVTGGNMLFAFYAEGHDDAAILSHLRRRFPKAAILGGTSCGGVMTRHGMGGDSSIGVLVIEDEAGNYGTALAPLGEDPAAAAERVLHIALDAAGCRGELPALIWIYQAPGREEQVIAGLRRVVGDGCPIIGGSAADQAVTGHWRQMAGDAFLADGIAVSVLFPSGGIGFAFQGGYEPAGPSGIVTKGSGRRILCIDGRPAAEVYDSWIGNALGDVVHTGGNILLATPMYPLAMVVGETDGLARYLLIHPETVTEDGGLTVFATVPEGARIYCMRGDRSRLIDRAGRVVGEAQAMLVGNHLLAGDNIAGGLVVYCAGCMLAVNDRMPDVASSVAASFGTHPFLGCFTFGEQGPLVDHNAHGNLMISAIAFGR